MLIREVEKPLDIRNPVEKIRILDKGYSWLQIAIDKEYYWLSAFYDDNGQLISIYFDMTDGNIIKVAMPILLICFLIMNYIKTRLMKLILLNFSKPMNLTLSMIFNIKEPLKRAKSSMPI